MLVIILIIATFVRWSFSYIWYWYLHHPQLSVYASNCWKLSVSKWNASAFGKTSTLEYNYEKITVDYNIYSITRINSYVYYNWNWTCNYTNRLVCLQSHWVDFIGLIAITLVWCNQTKLAFTLQHTHIYIMGNSMSNHPAITSTFTKSDESWSIESTLLVFKYLQI